MTAGIETVAALVEIRAQVRIPGSCAQEKGIVDAIVDATGERPVVEVETGIAATSIIITAANGAIEPETPACATQQGALVLVSVIGSFEHIGKGAQGHGQAVADQGQPIHAEAATGAVHEPGHAQGNIAHLAVDHLQTGRRQSRGFFR